jgi:hypothetical protein
VSLTIEQILASPEYFPVRFEGPNLIFVRMTRQTYLDSIFTLPNRIVTEGEQAWAVPLGDIVRMVEENKKELPSPHCIFQIAHCGSTLLSRSLDNPGDSLVIREPFALRQLTATPRSPNANQDKDRVRALQALWCLLSRQYQSNESVVLKGNVPINYSIPEIMESSPLSKGILLYSNFEDYMVASLKSDERRQWASHVAREMSPRIKAIQGMESLNIDSLTGAQAIAALWLSQIRLFEHAATVHPNLKPVLSDQLLESPSAVLSASVEHLALGITAEDQRRILESDLFKRHAKNPDMEFTIDEHRSQLLELKEKYSNEIAEVSTWCEANNYSTRSTLTQYALL